MESSKRRSIFLSLIFLLKREMSILLSVKCETAVLFSVKRDQTPPPPLYHHLIAVADEFVVANDNLKRNFVIFKSGWPSTKVWV